MNKHKRVRSTLRISYKEVVMTLTTSGIIDMKPGMINDIDVHHDDWCPIYHHKQCQCNFYIKFNDKVVWTEAQTIQANKELRSKQ
jgi:hypothetical protein